MDVETRRIAYFAIAAVVCIAAAAWSEFEDRLKFERNRNGWFINGFGSIGIGFMWPIVLCLGALALIAFGVSRLGRALVNLFDKESDRA